MFHEMYLPGNMNTYREHFSYFIFAMCCRSIKTVCLWAGVPNIFKNNTGYTYGNLVVKCGTL
jgi:hypothetical protein